MTKEEKDLLLKDLCARLPYEVKAYIKNWSKLDQKYYEGVYTVKFAFPSLNEVHAQSETGSIDVILGYADYFIKPYLFPLSSMTEEQKEEYCQLQERVIYNSKGPVNKDVVSYIDWLNKNHFDYRGLIEKGLANDATGLNIY